MNEGIIKSNGTFNRISINSNYVNINTSSVGNTVNGAFETSSRVKVTKDEVMDMLKEKQDKLVAGSGIKLDETTNEISVVQEGENVADLTALYLLAKGEN